MIISPESWSDLFVSKHHYALALSRENEVYFLNPPSTQFKLTQIHASLIQVDYKPKFKGVQILPSFVANFLMRREFGYLKKRINKEIDVVWSFDPSRFFNLNVLPIKYGIAHIVDLNQVFQREQLLKTADLRLTVSNHLQKVFERISSPVINLGHGFNPNFSKLNQDKLPGTNSVKAVYMGNLIRYSIDWSILQEAASNHPDIDFLFYGPLPAKEPTEMKFVQNLSNCFFLGKIDSDLIQSVLNLSDIQIISFKEEHHIDQTNSHKILEYMASGKIIVATFTADYENQTDLMVMCKRNQDFHKIFSKVAANLNYYNSDLLQEKRKELADSQTYEEKLKFIDQLIVNSMP